MPSTAPPPGASTSPTALPRSPELQAYCNWTYQYGGVTSKIDFSNVESAMSGLEIAAQVGKRAAESAPQEVRAAQQDIAAFNDELITQLKQRSPTTIAELQTALNEANDALKKKYSNYDRDSQVIQAFDHTNCGLESG